MYTGKGLVKTALIITANLTGIILIELYIQKTTDAKLQYYCQKIIFMLKKLLCF